MGVAFQPRSHDLNTKMNSAAAGLLPPPLILVNSKIIAPSYHQEALMEIHLVTVVVCLHISLRNQCTQTTTVTSIIIVKYEDMTKKSIVQQTTLR